ncbi:MAG: hypothetical protein AAGC55_00275 [Myxococcota bacterium]
MSLSEFRKIAGLVLLIATISVSACESESELQRVDRVVGNKRITGTLKNGKKHGQWVSISDYGAREMKSWKDGIRHGPSIFWLGERHPITGEVSYSIGDDANYAHGKFHGRWREFYTREQISVLGWMRRGKRHGPWCHWTPDGNLEKIVEYHKDRWIREVLNPDLCPHTQGSGRRHLDPDNTDYE